MNSIEEVIDDIKLGKIIILYDETRECEGDFLIASEFASKQNMNFMMTYGRGLIYLTITQERADQLDLSLMCPDCHSIEDTKFTQSIDLKSLNTTGISANDKANVSNAIANDSILSDDLIKPGHSFPIISHPEGLKTRKGHTESSIELIKLAGLYPSATGCEILNQDGDVANYQELVELSKRFEMKMTTIQKLLDYLKL